MAVKSSRFVWTIHYTEGFGISSSIRMIGQQFQIQTRLGSSSFQPDRAQ